MAVSDEVSRMKTAKDEGIEKGIQLTPTKKYDILTKEKRE